MGFGRSLWLLSPQNLSGLPETPLPSGNLQALTMPSGNQVSSRWLRLLQPPPSTQQLGRRKGRIKAPNQGPAWAWNPEPAVLSTTSIPLQRPRGHFSPPSPVQGSHQPLHPHAWGSPHPSPHGPGSPHPSAYGPGLHLRPPLPPSPGLTCTPPPTAQGVTSPPPPHGKGSPASSPLTAHRDHKVTILG